MAPKKKSGRIAAEAAYAELMREATTLVGDVGAAYQAYAAKLDEAAAARVHYEDARAAAVKAGALTSDQLDQMGYKKTQKLPLLTSATDADAPTPKPQKVSRQKASTQNPMSSRSDPQPNGAVSTPALASVGGPNTEGN